jgi:hypothetical protein
MLFNAIFVLLIVQHANAAGVTTTPNSVVKAASASTCDPFTMNTDAYPSILTKLEVVLTNPLTLRATMRLLNSTKVITFEGAVFRNGFNDDHALVACRSMGCSRVSSNAGVGWNQTQTCRFTCPDGTSGLQTCRFMQAYFACPSNPNDAMSLKECLNRPFWEYSSHGTNYAAAAIICTECGN